MYGRSEAGAASRYSMPRCWAAERLSLETDLRRAVERQFAIHYQPSYGSRTRNWGFEALLRWDHRGAWVSAEFIPLLGRRA
jgi:EAL domain-containing protein (putative c-di-GMP-specific phosphodiesterase class I)